MTDPMKTTARLIGHMTNTQAPAVSEKNIFYFLFYVFCILLCLNVYHDLQPFGIQ